MNDESKQNVMAVTSPVEPAGRPRRNGVSRLADAAAFLRGFLTHPFEVASVLPSSVHLENYLVRAAALPDARCVVELGPGTGGTTRALLRSMAPQARLLAVERDPDFCCRLRHQIDDPRLAVHAGSALSLGDALHMRGLPAADVVISGIPFSTLPSDAARQTAAAICDNLAPGGRIVAYQWRPQVAGYIAPFLGPPRAAWEWRNFPPMRVFVWLKPTKAKPASEVSEPGAANGASGSDPHQSAG